MEKEMRLIDANALTHKFLLMPGHYRKAEIDLIDSEPTVDAVEVIHGRWEQHPKYDDYEWCSACHDCLVAKGWEQKSKLYYCPNCGAKMDKENID